MRKPQATPIEPAPLPGWITATPAETLAAAAFRSGAALAQPSRVTTVGDVPMALGRDRLALAAAAVCAAIPGHPDGVGTMRDALHLARPVDDPGPAGRVLRQWSRVVARPILVAGPARAPEDVAADGVAPP